VSGVELTRLAALLLPLLVAAAAALWVARRRRVARALGDAALLRRLLGEDLARLPALTLALLLLAATALGASLALAAPDLREPERAPTGGPVVLVLDASNSMLVADVQPDRLEAQRAAARELVATLPERQFGIVVFAGRAFTLTPPTPDPAAVELYLASLHPEMVTQTGSAIAAALRQGLALLLAVQEELGPGALVLVSDGDELDEAGDIAAALGLARRADVTVHTLATGTPAGGPVPRPAGVAASPGDGGRYMTGPEGATVVSRLGEALLREIAAGTGGVYRDVRDPGAVAALATALGAGRGEPRRGRVPAHVWLTGIALLLLSIETGRGALPRREAE
jgi:Ca-activated chloride channel homolog